MIQNEKSTTGVHPWPVTIRTSSHGKWQPPLLDSLCVAGWWHHTAHKNNSGATPINICPPPPPPPPPMLQSTGINKSTTVGHQKKWKTTKALTASVSLEWQGSPVGSQCLKVTWSTSQRTKVLGQLPPVAADRPDRRASNNRAPQPIPSHCAVSIPTSCALTTTFLFLSQSFNWWKYYGIPYNFSVLVIFTQLILTDWQITELPTSPANDTDKDTYVTPPPFTPPPPPPPFLTLLVPMSANAGILLNWSLLLLYWKETLDGNSWKGTLRNSNRKLYATVVLTITTAKTHKLFRLPVQVNCLLTRLKELKKIKKIFFFKWKEFQS